MKKVLLAAAMMISSVAAFAQHAVGTVTIQPKVGLNIANFTDADDADARVGFVAGAEFEYQVSDIFSLSAGALYSQQGAKMNSETQALDYINVPVMANVYVAPGFAVKLGVQPGFCVAKKYREKNNITGRLQKGDIETLDRKFDLAIPVGLSYELPNGVTFDARYNIGLLKAIREYQESGRYKVGYNSVFQLTIGYKFVL